MNILKYFSLGILAAFSWSCEDVVDIQTDNAPTQLVIDAWINDLPQAQIIRITETAPYFVNEFTPGVPGASVRVVTEEGHLFVFEGQGNGNYVWMPPPDSTFGTIGKDYTLLIDHKGRSLQSQSRMHAVPPIDSIVQEFREDELGGPDGIYAQFFARDLPGLGNTYWIKTYKNGMYLNKPEEINIAYDAGFDAGAEIDHIIFIPPIRELVNPVPDSADTDTPRYEVGDQIRVEIHSITLEAFLFMESARDQILNGNNTIFASPIANSPGNIISTTDDEEVLGVFCVSAVSLAEKVIE